jgi:hypothetical protein
MQLSLRTLLAFEDNVFDVEQHRRLEQLLDHNAEATLGRIRSVTRNSKLGVPGLVDQQEELDPNYVAEYLDHQMPAEVQARFETYCLSADKYLAEIASIHHILSNVLGEPARTSRDCRLKCYEVVKHSETEERNVHLADPKQSKHFHPFEPQKPSSPETHRYLAPLWNLLFPSQKEHGKQPVQTQEKKSSLWSFTSIGLLVCALLLGWQQIEKQRDSQQQRAEATASVLDNPIFESTDQPTVAAFAVEPFVPPELAPPEPLAPFEPIAAFTTESFPPSLASPVAAPFAAVVEVPEERAEPFKGETVAEIGVIDTALTNDPPQTKLPEATTSGTAANDPVITFQPIIAKQQADRLLARGPTEILRANPRPAMPATAWQSSEPPVMPVPVTTNAPPFAERIPYPQPIVQTSGTVAVPRVLGRAIPTSQPSVIFSAATSSKPWYLHSLPFDLNGEQYLLTASPFRGTFELAAGFRIEMIGDSKLCLLPLDASGTPGIFVDYGRIVIQPLQANVSLRIETEKSSGFFSATGTNSVLFIDTFAEISQPSRVSPPEEQKKETSPILGFVPKNGERIVWKSISQPQPFMVESLGCILLQSDQYRFEEVRVPSWLKPIPMSQEEHMLSEACRRYFVEARGNAEQALTWLMQDESQAVRTLGLRLWGDLGQFDVPLSVMEHKREEEAIRRILVNYFKEVMRRDAETVQRFADAIAEVKRSKAVGSCCLYCAMSRLVCPFISHPHQRPEDRASDWRAGPVLERAEY